MVKEIRFPDLAAASAFMGRYGFCETTVYSRTKEALFIGEMVQSLSAAVDSYAGRDLQQVLDIEIWLDRAAPVIGIIREPASLELLRLAHNRAQPSQA